MPFISDLPLKQWEDSSHFYGHKWLFHTATPTTRIFQAPLGQGENQGHGSATPLGIASNEEGHLFLAGSDESF